MSIAHSITLYNYIQLYILFKFDIKEYGKFCMLHKNSKYEKFTIKQVDISMSILRKQTRNSLCVIFAGNNLIVYIDFVLAGL